MKLKKLTIHNLASIADAEIDFCAAPLGEAPLFLLCGETGAGKTTVLDAICLALYSHTPRYEDVSKDKSIEVSGLAYNDALQLVRRGAGEACVKLSFQGNDGLDYEAEWGVEAYKKTTAKGAVKGTLNPATEYRTWKCLKTGAVTEFVKSDGMPGTATKQLHPLIAATIGLDFSQFTRTTMLAQGQFTKFLLSDDDEKAQILEKLTDTSRYSELGRVIAAKYTKLRGEVESLDREVKSMSGLGDERVRIETRIVDLDALVKTLGAQYGAASAKLNWLQGRDNLAGVKRETERKLMEAFASLKALERKTEGDIAEANARVEELTRYFRESEGRKGMYDNSAVILQALRDVREARMQKENAEEERAKSAAAIPGLERKVGEAKEELEAAKKAVGDKVAEIECEEQALNALAPDKVQQDRTAAGDRRGELKELKEQIRGVEALKRDIGDREESIKVKQAELGRLQNELPGLKAEAEKFHETLTQVTAACDRQRKLIDDGIEKVIADLKVGDECPICGHRIEKLKAREVFVDLFNSLDAKCKVAKSDCDEADKKCNETESRVSVLEDAIGSHLSEVCKWKAAREGKLKEIDERVKTLGVTAATEEGVDGALSECEKIIAELEGKLRAIGDKGRAITELRKQQQELVNKKDTAIEANRNADKSLDAGKAKVVAWQQAIGVAEQRATQKLKEAKERISVEGWIEEWERDSKRLEENLASEAKEFADKRDELQNLKPQCDEKVRFGERIVKCAERAVGKLPSIGEVLAGAEAASDTSEVEGLMGSLDSVNDSYRRHLDSRPKDMTEADSIANLTETVRELGDKKDAANTELGSCRQRIEDDNMRAKEREDKRAKMDELAKLRDEWKPIYEYYGDADGKKIRREIQAYVLTNVLVKANHYLKQLSDRYELANVGLTLTVRDYFEGGVERPAKTLSGGEGFLVSLALALGLASLNENGLSVDMLFIDEGFGTLSGEHLDSAIDTLERLNSVAGARKVGVISHVERLRERIQTHIEVMRNGHGPSEVDVLVNGRA